MGRKVWKRNKGRDLNAKLNGKHHLTTPTHECYFRELDKHLVNFVQGSHSVVACVAWMTNQNVIQAFVERPSLIILRNERWLNKKGGLAKKTRSMYGQLHTSTDKFTVLGKELEQDIQVCGFLSHPQNMHHKFVVRLGENGEPLSVWTGSYNPTTNGNQSIENALVIHDKQIASAYCREFLQVYKISKSLKVG